MSKENCSSALVQVSGTGALSFEVWPGMELTVKRFSPPSYRPSIGRKFHSTHYLLFNGITKIGQISSASLTNIGAEVPERCKVVEVNKDKNLLIVEFEVSNFPRII